MGLVQPGYRVCGVTCLLLALPLHVLSYCTTQLAWPITLLVTSLLLDGTARPLGPFSAFKV